MIFSFLGFVVYDAWNELYRLIPLTGLMLFIAFSVLISNDRRKVFLLLMFMD